MKKEVSLVMFDLDGTLANTGKDLANAVNHFRSCFGLEPVENQRVFVHVGHGSEFLIRNCLPEQYQHRFKEAMGLFFDHYQNHLLDTTVLYPHVEDILNYFRKKKRAVVSNKLYRFTVAVLKGLGIESCFDAVLGGDSGFQKKPDPEILNKVLGTFEVKPEMALIIGDGSADIEAGKRAGVYTCGVTYGLGLKEELIEAKPDFLIDDLKQLTEHFH